MASPLSTPGTARTASPLTFQEDIAQSLSSSPDDAHTTATHEEADDGWPSQLTVPNAAGASTAAEPVKHVSKGKEKAGKGPLRLLDLPVDILKDIIHQVCMAAVHAHVAVRWRCASHHKLTMMANSCRIRTT